MRDYGDDVFKGAAEYYAQYRPRYPKQLFSDITSTLKLDGHGTLLDLGCGTGEVAVPLAGHFKEVVAWDPDPQMLGEAKKRAAAAGATNIAFARKSSKDLPSLDTPLRLVAMGQSFHWMDQRPVLEQLYKKVERGGGIVIIGTEPSRRPSDQNDLSAKKNEAIQMVIKKYIGGDRRAGSKVYVPPEDSYEELLPSSSFSGFQARTYTVTLTRNLDEIMGHLFSMSWANKRLFGENAASFEREVRDVLLGLEPTGIFTDTIKFAMYTALK